MTRAAGSDGVPPDDPRAGRFEALTGALRLDRIAVAIAAVAAIVLPGGIVSDVAGGVALAGVVASAPARVAWLAQRWLRKGDRLFGALAVLLFALPVVGLVLSGVV